MRHSLRRMGDIEPLVERSIFSAALPFMRKSGEVFEHDARGPEFKYIGHLIRHDPARVAAWKGPGRLRLSSHHNAEADAYFARACEVEPRLTKTVESFVHGIDGAKL